MKTLKTLSRWTGLLLYGLNFMLISIYALRKFNPPLSFLIEMVLVLLFPLTIYIGFKLTLALKKNILVCFFIFATYVALIIFTDEFIWRLTMLLLVSGFVFEYISVHRPDILEWKNTNYEGVYSSSDNIFSLDLFDIMQNPMNIHNDLI